MTLRNGWIGVQYQRDRSGEGQGFHIDQTCLLERKGLGDGLFCETVWIEGFSKSAFAHKHLGFPKISPLAKRLQILRSLRMEL
jgi:hypothetical protein